MTTICKKYLNDFGQLSSNVQLIILRKYHTNEYFPRCSGELGSSIATCTPAPSQAEINAAADSLTEVPSLNHDYDFEFDFSTITITPAVDRYDCLENGCSGAS